jgi:hypothetical protein
MREGRDTPEMMAGGFKRAVVPLDGSMVAEAILPQFLCVAHALSMDVALIRVVVPTKPVAIEEAPTERGKYTAMMERMLDEADTYLRSVVALPAFEGLKVMTTVRIGEARQEIIASAKAMAPTSSNACCSDPSLRPCSV